MKKTPLPIVCGLLAIWLAGCKTPPSAREQSSEEMTPQQRADAAWPEKVPSGKISFARQVRPILEIRCLECHNNKDASRFSGFSLETRQMAFNSGTRAPAIIPGNAAKSPLVQVLVLDYDHPTSMPPAPDKVWGPSLEILKKWIDQGAEWPENLRLVPPQEWES